MISSFLISLGLTRDSWVWFWSRLVGAALIVVAPGIIPLDQYVGEKWAKIIQIIAVLILWFAGKYDSSPLPGKK